MIVILAIWAAIASAIAGAYVAAVEDRLDREVLERIRRRKG